MVTSGLQPKKTFAGLLVLLVIILMALPFATAFNEFLTRVVENADLYKPIQRLVVPYMSRLVVGVLSFLPGLFVQTNSTTSGALYEPVGGRSA